MKTNVTDFRLDREVFIMKVSVRIIVSDKMRVKYTFLSILCALKYTAR